MARCPAGYFQLGTNYSCQPCATGCALCDGPTTNDCQECKNKSDGTIFYKYIGASTCGENFCPQGQYIDITKPNYCQQCNSNCNACEGSASNCTASYGCLTGSYYYTLSSVCIPICPEHYYANISNGQCTPCADGCETCFGWGAYKCYNCMNTTKNFYKQPLTTVCLDACPVGYFESDFGNICLNCNEACI